MPLSSFARSTENHPPIYRRRRSLAAVSSGAPPQAPPHLRAFLSCARLHPDQGASCSLASTPAVATLGWRRRRPALERRRGRLPSGSSSSPGSYWLPWAPLTSLPDAPPVPSHPCEVSRTDFAPYLAAVADPFARFADIRLHASAELAASDDGAPAASSSSSGLAACLREVPALFLKEDFALEEGATFEAAYPLGDGALQERHGQHLDIVEAHLVQEIARRSGSFYEAQGWLRGLDGEMQR